MEKMCETTNQITQLPNWLVVQTESTPNHLCGSYQSLCLCFGVPWWNTIIGQVGSSSSQVLKNKTTKQCTLQYQSLECFDMSWHLFTSLSLSPWGKCVEDCRWDLKQKKSGSWTFEQQIASSGGIQMVEESRIHKISNIRITDKQLQEKTCFQTQCVPPVC